ncbi:MAG: NifB/NifX family molybdenum-iron cluster-binding protein [Caldisericia bacterium]|nr:NifB/NifX family molybdenum-iron cluster-binding protein [Caldisericia bacterium]
MIIVIPCVDKRLCMHFGHCEQFAFVNVNENNEIEKTEMVTPPSHEPGLLPKWLGEKNANVIIAGGMGSRAQALFQQNGIKVVTGAVSDTPEDIVKAYFENTLKTGTNSCDH